MTEAKPFDIPKREVWEAFKKVKANQGAAGVDGQSIADFEVDLRNNLRISRIVGADFAGWRAANSSDGGQGWA